MKKLLTLLAVLAAPAAWAASGPMVLSNDSLPASSSFTANLQMYNNVPGASAGKISAAITVSSGNFSTGSFTDGRQSSGSITVVSTSILSGFAVNKITVPATTLLLPQSATAQIVISSCTPGAVFYANGFKLSEGTHFTCGVSSTTAATSLSTAIDIYANTMVSTNTFNVIFATAITAGPQGNSLTLGPATKMTYSTTTFSGGRNSTLYNQWIEFNGNRQYNGYAWSDQSGTSTGTATSIASWLNTFGVIDASSSGSSIGVVWATATVAGATANSYTLRASTTNLVITGGTFAGGKDADSVTINGRRFTAGVDFTTGTLAGTASSLATAINSSSMTTGVQASVASTVVTTTSTATGLASNYAMTSSSQSALQLSPPVVTTNGASVGAMTGGLDAAWTINTATITIASNGFKTGLGVVYATGTVAIGGLTNGTTYFVIVVNSNQFKLATSQTNALANVPINLTTGPAGATNHTYTLTPQAFAVGSAGGKWQVSNDNGAWADYTITSNGIVVAPNTFTPVFPSSTTVVDFGLVDYGYLRYLYTAPTTGSMNVKVILNAKD